MELEHWGVLQTFPATSEKNECSRLGFRQPATKEPTLRRRKCEYLRVDFLSANPSFFELSIEVVETAEASDFAILDRAYLTGATWTDGRICAAGSVGTCN